LVKDPQEPDSHTITLEAPQEVKPLPCPDEDALVLRDHGSESVSVPRTSANPTVFYV